MGILIYMGSNDHSIPSPISHLTLALGACHFQSPTQIPRIRNRRLYPPVNFTTSSCEQYMHFHHATNAIRPSSIIPDASVESPSIHESRATAATERNASPTCHNASTRDVERFIRRKKIGRREIL